MPLDWHYDNKEIVGYNTLTPHKLVFLTLGGHAIRVRNKVRPALTNRCFFGCAHENEAEGKRHLSSIVERNRFTEASSVKNVLGASIN